MGRFPHTDQRPDAVIADLAAKQRGLVTRAQLLAAGLTGTIVRSRIRAKLLHPIYPGVYQVGPVAPTHVRERAAALVCGPGAVVSHQSAASLWGLLPALGEDDPVDVSVQGDRRRRGIRAHRVSGLERHVVDHVDGIPITTPARTLCDLAGVLSRRELEQAMAKAERKELASPKEVRSLVDRAPMRRGNPLIRSILDAPASPALTRSEAEERLLALTRKARLPAPETNARVGRYEVDFLWRRQRLVVEVDGYAFHSSRRNFESDRSRDADLAAKGLQVIRFTWHQIANEPEATLARLAQVLARR